MFKKKYSDKKPVDKSRRNFFSQLTSETISMVDEFKGKPQMLLSEIDKVPEDIVRQMVPVFTENRPSYLEDSRLFVKNDKSGDYEEIYRLNPDEYFILKHFDGMQTLEDIAISLEEHSKQDSDAAFQLVRNIFITLAKIMICHPAHPHERNAEG
jgi:methyltransferase-like protein